MSDLEKAESILREYKQEHIIKLIEKLDEEKKNELVGQILKIDFNQIHELYENTKKQIEFKEKKIEPISYTQDQREHLN